MFTTLLIDCNRRRRPPEQVRMPIDPRELRRSANAPVSIVTTDRLCGRCRYNLKGLPGNGNCPECGKPIARRPGKRTFTDNLADAPLFYLKGLAAGLVLLSVSSLGGVVSFLLLGGTRHLGAALLAGVCSIAWWTGVFIVTGQRARAEHTLYDEVLDSSRLRAVNRLLQLAWPAATLAWAAAFAVPAPLDKGLVFTGLGLAVIGLFGLVPLSLHLSSLAFWANDTHIGERLRFIAWGFAVMGLLVVAGSGATAAGGLLQGLFFLLSVWSSMGLVIAELLFLWSLIQLAHETLWAVRNNNTAAEVAQRLHIRRGNPLALRTCSECGYDISSLPVMARCPECGHLEESVRQSGLLVLQATRQAAENHPEADEVIPLEPAKPGSDSTIKPDIRFSGSIGAGRQYPAAEQGPSAPAEL
jgi:hypothetical protein